MAEDRQKERKKRVSTSYLTGVIALVFLIIGYQTALFVHSAVAARITADVSDLTEEETDSDGADAGISGSGGAGGSIGIGGSISGSGGATKQSKGNTSVGAKPRAMSFPFNPNTVSVSDLVKLGFSRKQAESIDKYRKKGGRFRRKDDFAKSYVVADSVYRRLEPYIRIPLLDINTADSASFDNLPGIGGYFASKILSYRHRMGGFSYKEQLMDILDKERFDGLSDLICVSPPDSFRLWTLPEDSLKRHPYIGTYAAHGIVIFRKNNPVESWTIDALAEAGVLKKEDAAKLSRCLVASP